ncbi:MAG: thioredoxin family protein [bacterium]|nr:thioredoxin family protein [bacterium]
MMKKSFQKLLILMLGFLLCGCSEKINAGQTAPDFSLPSSQGELIKLSDQRGKFVVLEWFNDGCPFVKKHYNSGNMQALQKKFTDQGVVWLTILSSAPGKQGHRSPEEIKQIMKEKGGAQTYVLLDPMGKVGRLYGAKTTPHMFVLNPKGETIYQGAIDSTASTDPADIPHSTNYVAEALSQALAGQAVAHPATTPYGCSVKYQ